MTLAAEKNDQSMEDILSSIRKIISEEDKAPHPSEVLTTPDDEEPLVLTKIIPDDGNVVSFNAPEQIVEDTMTDEKTIDTEIDSVPEEAMELQEEQMISEEAAPLAEEVEAENPQSPDMEDVVSNEALTQAAAALSSLSKLGSEVSQPKNADPVGGQTVDNLMREVLRPLLREWIDANLPSLVRVVVNEHVGRIVRQMGHDTPVAEETEAAKDAS